MYEHKYIDFGLKYWTVQHKYIFWFGYWTQIYIDSGLDIEPKFALPMTKLQ